MSFTDLLAAADRLSLAAMGEPVVYTPGAGAPATVQAFFDTAYVRVDVGEAGVSSCGPAAFAQLADLPSDPEADVDATVRARGVLYSIREVKPDGQGAVLLLLHEV